MMTVRKYTKRKKQEQIIIYARVRVNGRIGGLVVKGSFVSTICHGKTKLKPFPSVLG